MKRFSAILLVLILVVSTSVSISATTKEESTTAATTYTWPVPASKRVTQGFNPPDHNGIDIGGSTAGVAGDRIVAMYKGNVERAGWSSSYGWVVYVNHEGSDQMNGQNIQSRYAHMMDTPTVSYGQRVYGGTTLGYMGNTGNSFGVHLHHETRDCGSGGCDASNDSTPINPNLFYSGFQTGSIELVSAEEADLVQSEEQIDLSEEVFYSTEEILAMTKEERESKGIPEPYQYKELYEDNETDKK